jgi:hypothetical protein
MRNFRSISLMCAAAILLAGCGASLPGLTTGSLFGGSAKAPAAAPVAKNDPVSRAMQVGTTSARAQKCGFNFDAVKLRTQFLAAEGTQLTNPTEITNLGKVYDIAYGGIGKAVAEQGEGYCSETKTKKIKEALNRHLAGDYTPTPPEPVAAEETIFDSFGSSSSGYDHAKAVNQALEN